MTILYVIAILSAIALAPAIVFRPWNAGARWMRRRAARLTILPALLLAGCNLGDASEVEINGGVVDASAEAGTPCAEQDPACPDVFPHALTCPFYDGGPCQLGQCIAPWLDCNHDLADGCETDTNADPANCGTCGAACDSGVCEQGVCK